MKQLRGLYAQTFLLSVQYLLQSSSQHVLNQHVCAVDFMIYPKWFRSNPPRPREVTKCRLCIFC